MLFNFMNKFQEANAASDKQPAVSETDKMETEAFDDEGWEMPKPRNKKNRKNQQMQQQQDQPKNEPKGLVNLLFLFFVPNMKCI